MELSVVVPTYNQASLLRECLRSLTDQTLRPETYEIVIVDDGSTDHTAAVLEEFSSRVKTVRFPANRGRSAARNAGIAHATAPLIVFVDSDVVVRPDFLQWHLHTHRTHGPGIVSRGPVVLTHDPAAAGTGRMPRFAITPAFLDTANAAVEKVALIRAGLFDEDFPGYGWEDFDLGLRLKRLGIRRAFCRQAVAFHVQPDPREYGVDALLQKEEERAKSAVYFFRKHPTMETRLLIQATPLHRALFWVGAACGMLTPKNLHVATAGLRSFGLTGLAYLALRSVLNRHYIHTLNSEFRRHAAALA